MDLFCILMPFLSYLSIFYLLCYFVDDFPFLSTASQSAFLPLGPCWAIEFPRQINKRVCLVGMGGRTQQWGVRDQFQGHVKDIFECILAQLRCISHVFAHRVE